MNCKSYIPGYYTTRGLNKDRGNSWPIYYDNTLLNGHLHNSCMLSSLKGYSEYDKEMLKRTILEHEAIFRKQVYELHRLYRIQKDLMEEFQKNGLYRFSTWTVKSKASLSSSEVQSQVAGRVWQMYNQSALSSSQSRETTTVTNTNVSPISTLRSCFSTLENGTPRDGESNCICRASTKRMFDIQVPADVSIYAEGTDRSEKEEITGFSLVTTAPYSRKCNGDPDNEVELTLTNLSSANGGAHKHDSHRKNSLFHCLSDLNEPIEDTSLVGTAYSLPSRHLGLETQDENHMPNGSLRSTNLWLQISSSTNQDRDEIGSLKKELGQTCSHFLGEAGKSKLDLSLDSVKEKCSMSFEPIQMSLIKASDILLNDLNKAPTLFAPKKDNSLETPRKSSDSAISDSSEKLASLNINVPTLPMLPTWMKPSGGENQSSAPLQTISSFDESITMNNFRILETTTDDPGGHCDRLQYCSDLKSIHLENGKFSLQNGFNHVFDQDSCSVSQLGISYDTLNLNLRESCSFDVHNGVTAPKDNSATGEMDSNCEELKPELPCLENKPNCHESLNLNRSSSRVDLCFSTSGLGYVGAVEIETSMHSCNLENLPSNLDCSEEKTQRNEVPDCSSREKIIELPILDKILPNLNILNERHQLIDELQHGSVFRDINPLNTEKNVSAENSRSFRNHIDLNCEVTFIDEPIFSKMSDQSPVCVPSQTSDTLSSSKAFPLMDMDRSVMTLEENNTTEIESTPCSIRDDSQPNECSHDMFIKEAAENLIVLSFDKFKHLDDDQSCLATEPPCNTLHWFADVALSKAHMKTSDVEMDLFELMTLQLEEMKPEETWCKPLETENAKDDEKSRALLLSKKPRRGLARKRRQRRDFQKDILPGLATLSRKEILEDLQLIGGLTKASGCHWEVSAGRRNASQNGTPVKAKRRQLPRKTTIAVPKKHDRPQQTLFLYSKNANNPKFVVDRPGMLGWGRTTRRCRRPRCHPSQSVATGLT